MTDPHKNFSKKILPEGYFPYSPVFNKQKTLTVMKKLIALITFALILGIAVPSAQTPAELAQQQRELNQLNRRLLEAKPTKEAKKEAKRLRKAGWEAPAGDRAIENQITSGQLLGAELMADRDGSPAPRYIQHTAVATAGTYNAAFAAARANAMAEVASMLESEIAAAVQVKTDNAQDDTQLALTVDKFNQRMRSIVNASLSGALPVVTIYRTLPNRNVEVQVRLAYDKKAIANKFNRQLREQLEEEGDQLNDLAELALQKMM